MIFREATVNDIPQIQAVRHSVKENVLSNPALVTNDDCKEYITNRGKGWVCEVGNHVVAFAIADLAGNNIWALFVSPEYEKKGIGKKLHNIMLNWYFSQGKENVWLSTAQETRAEQFYKMNGWRNAGMQKNNEVRFEMNITEWKKFLL